MSMFSSLYRFVLALVVCITAAPAWAQFGQGGNSFGDPFGGDEDPAVSVSVIVSDDQMIAGGRIVLAVVLDHADKFHSNLNEPIIPPEMEGFIPVSTEIISLTNGVEFGPIQWPETHAVPVNFTGTPVDFYVYSDRAVAYVPVRIPEGTVSGPYPIKLELTFQACDDVSCLPPETVELDASIEIVDELPSQSRMANPEFEDFDYTVFDRAWDDSEVKETQSTDEPVASGSTFFGINIPQGGGVVGLVFLAVLGAAGGLILNLTPCVLPVIPIKIMTLSQHAGENRGRAAYLGFWMAIGVIAFWAALAIPVLALKGFTDPSRVFGIWWLTTGIGVIIAVMSLGLMGMFNISLPDKVYMINPKADSASGSFMFGVMTAVLGLPCFGFVAGALVPTAIGLGTGFVIVLFTSLGVGMALPYLVLSIFPGLLKKLPRTGPASDLVKQIMGLLLLAAAAYFIGAGLIALVASEPYLAKLLHVWVAAIFGTGAGLWLVIKTFQISKKALNRAVFSIIAIVIAGFGLLIATSFTNDAREDYEIRSAAIREAGESGELLRTIWVDYSPTTMQRALDEGLVVIQDFTAEWCINCKVLEKTVLGKAAVKAELQADDTVMIKVDLTGKNPDGEKALTDLGRSGIPTLAIYGPGLDEPWVASAYTADQVLSAIKRARGG